MFAGKESRWSLAEPNHKMESCKDLELGQEDSEASSRTEGYYTPPEEEREKASLGESEEADEATPRQPFPLSNVSVSQLDSTFSSESPIGTLEATSKLGSRNLEGCLENFDLSNDLEQLKQLGNHFFTQGDYSAAINCYNAILESTPKKLSVLANR